jgi:hypothetical protein
VLRALGVAQGAEFLPSKLRSPEFKSWYYRERERERDWGGEP